LGSPVARSWIFGRPARNISFGPNGEFEISWGGDVGDYHNSPSFRKPKLDNKRKIVRKEM